VIVDYKTDSLADESAMMLRAEFHRPQMAAYARALARIGVRVKETFLVFLAMGQAVRVNPLVSTAEA